MTENVYVIRVRRKKGNKQWTMSKYMISFARQKTGIERDEELAFMLTYPISDLFVVFSTLVNVIVQVRSRNITCT